ncbi:hypothetical protein ISN44_As09g008040 [Arabidopsis suecica]|uniref:Pectinesterase inhibitor domain-containing protein n=1 Tax=Arabidopsis suecica TaxID=45249 RepID=A0A8T2AEK6_ARASU|nr:hypothetical protein ISN44_As09g008040 [Arabidopsis suecica]
MTLPSNLLMSSMKPCPDGIIYANKYSTKIKSIPSICSISIHKRELNQETKMGYERLGPSGATGSVPTSTTIAPILNKVSTSSQPENNNRGSKKKLVVSSIVLAISLILAAAIFAGVRSRLKLYQSVPGLARKSSQAISKACGLTRFPELCVDSLMDFPGSLAASSSKDLIHVTVRSID